VVEYSKMDTSLATLIDLEAGEFACHKVPSRPILQTLKQGSIDLPHGNKTDTIHRLVDRTKVEPDSPNESKEELFI
jgi:hypothetical protein